MARHKKEWVSRNEECFEYNNASCPWPRIAVIFEAVYISRFVTFILKFRCNSKHSTCLEQACLSISVALRPRTRRAVYRHFIFKLCLKFREINMSHVVHVDTLDIQIIDMFCGIVLCCRSSAKLKQLLFSLHLRSPVHDFQVAHDDPANSCLSVASLQCFVARNHC